MRIGLILSTLLLIAKPASADLFITLNPSTLTGRPGDSLGLFGTIRNDTAERVFISGIGAVLPTPDLLLDDSAFFALVPQVLQAGESYSGLLFRIDISPLILPESYSGQLDLLGGPGPLVYDPVGGTTFAIVITPEPSPGLLCFALLVLMIGWRLFLWLG